MVERQSGQKDASGLLGTSSRIFARRTFDLKVKDLESRTSFPSILEPPRAHGVISNKIAPQAA